MWYSSVMNLTSTTMFWYFLIFIQGTLNGGWRNLHSKNDVANLTLCQGSHVHIVFLALWLDRYMAISPYCHTGCVELKALPQITPTVGYVISNLPPKKQIVCVVLLRFHQIYSKNNQKTSRSHCMPPTQTSCTITITVIKKDSTGKSRNPLQLSPATSSIILGDLPPKLGYLMYLNDFLLSLPPSDLTHGSQRSEASSKAP